jgi:fructuronate reductase
MTTGSAAQMPAGHGQTFVSSTLLPLSPANLGRLPPTVIQPAYDRTTLGEGIVHLGIGAFMRAHLAVATEQAIAASGDLGWGIVGVSLRQPDTRDALAPQAGLYAVAVRDADEDGQARQTLQVIGAITRVLVAPEDPAAVLALIASPGTRIVSLTVTEKGYAHDPATRKLRTVHPDIAHDMVHPRAPRSAVGMLVHGLALRRAAGRDPVTLLSLDNLPANGHTLRGLVLDFAQRVDPSLARWIEAGCTFPNSMVDRIVPRTTDPDRVQVAAALGMHDAWPVMAEPFFDWAVEDHFAAGRPNWEAAGVRFVPEAAPWETLKLRMVNGAHSAIAYLSALAGWQTVDVAIAQPALRRYVDALMRDEIEPTLPALPDLNLGDYRQRLLQRFANPALAHRTLQIAMDGSQKIPQRWLNTVRERLAAGHPIDHLALALAAWLQFLQGRDDHGNALPLDDPLADTIRSRVHFSKCGTDPYLQVRNLTGIEEVFDDLARSQALVDAMVPALSRIRTHGAAACLASLRFD